MQHEDENEQELDAERELERLMRSLHERRLAKRIESVRSKLHLEEHYPPISQITDSWGVEPDDYYEHDRLRADFGLSFLESELAKNPADMATRFVALGEFCPPASDPHYSPETNQRVKAKFLRRLEKLVRLLPVELCNDWKTIRWEILRRQRPNRV